MAALTDAVRRDGRWWVERACEHCRVIFWTRIRKDGVHFQRFCSRQCVSLSRRTRPSTKKITQKRANRVVERALAKGLIKVQPCEICGDPNAHAHHDDYSKPLEIRWFCQKHHNRLHKIGRPRRPETVRRISRSLKLYRANLSRLASVGGGAAELSVGPRGIISRSADLSSPFASVRNGKAVREVLYPCLPLMGGRPAPPLADRMTGRVCGPPRVCTPAAFSEGIQK